MNTFSTLREYGKNLNHRVIVILIVSFILVGGTWIFFEIIQGISEKETVSFDTSILKITRNPDDPAITQGPVWLPGVVRDITALGSGAVLAIVVLAVTLYLLLIKKYNAAVLVLGATIGGTILVSVIKMIIGRARPDVVPALMTETSLSFPSGHAAMSAVVYLSLAALLARMEFSYKIKIYIMSVALLLTFMIGLTRIFLGVHYPTDVLGGWTIGIAWATFCWFIAWYLESKKNVKTDS